MKVLLICHALAPGRGSEPGFSWNWASSLSRYHEIWVLAHPEFRLEVDAELARHPNPQLHVVWLKGTDWDPTKGQRGVHWHYVRWLHQAQRLGRSLHAVHRFDLVHHISLGTIGVPPDWWKLPVPFVWGPLGGARDLTAAAAEPLRRTAMDGMAALGTGEPAAMVSALPRRGASERRGACRQSQTERFLRAVGGQDVPLFWDSGVTDGTMPPCPAERPRGHEVRVFWASRFQKRKALPLALEAMALLTRRAGVRLVVAGGGEEAVRWRALTTTMGLDDRVTFTGELQPARMREEFQRADIFLFTSVRDSFGTVVLEAMTYGVPVVALDLHGVAARMPADAGIKVPVASREETVRRLAAGLERLADNPGLRYEMGVAGWRYARTQLWSARAAEMNLLYRRVAAAPHAGATTATERRGAVVQS